MTQRFYAHQWGDDGYQWNVDEVPGGGHTEPIKVLSWLTEDQAKTIAAFLNDTAGYNWHERHPDWFAKVKAIRAIWEQKNPPPWRTESK